MFLTMTKSDCSLTALIFCIIFTFYGPAHAGALECGRSRVVLQRPPLRIVIPGYNQILEEGGELFSPSRGDSSIFLEIPNGCDGGVFTLNSLEDLHEYLFEALNGEVAKDILRYYKFWPDEGENENVTHGDILALREFIEETSHQGGLDLARLDCAGTTNSPYSALIISSAAKRVEQEYPEEYDNFDGRLPIELARNLWKQCQNKTITELR
jgi:hypothetical protein